MVGNRKLLLVIATLASSACSFLTGLAASFAMLSKEVRLVTLTRQDCEDALEALSAGAGEPRLMVTDTIPLDATPATFEALKRRTHRCKVLIAP